MTEPMQATDECLAREAAAGSTEVFGELVRRHGGRIFAYCRRRVSDPAAAEDLAQQVFVAAFRRIGGYNAARPFLPWLYTVARCVAIDESRRARRVPRAVDVPDGRVDAATPSDALSSREAVQGLWARARQVLRPRQFEALELRVRADLDTAAVAAAMGLTQTHVKVLLFRARRALLAAGADQELRESAAGRAASPASAVAATEGRVS